MFTAAAAVDTKNQSNMACTPVPMWHRYMTPLNSFVQQFLNPVMKTQTWTEDVAQALEEAQPARLAGDVVQHRDAQHAVAAGGPVFGKVTSHFCPGTASWLMQAAERGDIAHRNQGRSNRKHGVGIWMWCQRKIPYL